MGQHIIPIIGINYNTKGKLQNDIHILTIHEQKHLYNDNEYEIKTKEAIKQLNTKNKEHKKIQIGNTDIKIYDKTKHFSQYIVLRHRKLPLVMGCPKRMRSCKNNKCRPKQNGIESLLTDSGKRFMKARLNSMLCNPYIKPNIYITHQATKNTVALDVLYSNNINIKEGKYI